MKESKMCTGNLTMLKQLQKLRMPCNTHTEKHINRTA